MPVAPDRLVRWVGAKARHRHGAIFFARRLGPGREIVRCKGGDEDGAPRWVGGVTLIEVEVRLARLRGLARLVLRGGEDALGDEIGVGAVT